MSLKTRKYELYAKAEGTYGVDSTPDQTDAILAANVSHQPVNAQVVERPADRSKFGNKRGLHAGVHVAISFEVELVGSGTLGTAPAWGKLLNSFTAETISASTSVAYTPDTDATGSLTMVYNCDGNFHKATGCRCSSFEIVYNDLAVPVMRFTFLGIYVAPTAVALAGASGQGDYRFPRIVSSTNTDLTIDSTAVVMRSFTFNAGLQVEYFDDEGVVEATDRRSTAQLAILNTAIGTKNWITTVLAENLIQMELNHHQVDADRVILHTPSATFQLVQPSYADDRGRNVINLQGRYEPTASLDDEWEIKLAAAA